MQTFDILKIIVSLTTETRYHSSVNASHVPWITFLNSIIKQLYNPFKYIYLCVWGLYGLQSAYPYPIKKRRIFVGLCHYYSSFDRN